MSLYRPHGHKSLSYKLTIIQMRYIQTKWLSPSPWVSAKNDNFKVWECGDNLEPDINTAMCLLNLKRPWCEKNIYEIHTYYTPQQQSFCMMSPCWAGHENYALASTLSEHLQIYDWTFRQGLLCQSFFSPNCSNFAAKIYVPVIK